MRLGDNSVKYLPHTHEDKFGTLPAPQVKRLGMAVHTWNLSPSWGDMAMEIPRARWQPVQPNQQAPGSTRDPVSNTKVEKDKGSHLTLTPSPHLYLHTHARVPAFACAHVYT